MEIGDLRSHTFSWREYSAARAAAREMTGREYLEAMRTGTMPAPPFVAALGLQLAQVGDGRVVFTLEPQAYMHNGIGLLHGGVAAAMFDTAVGCACMTVVPHDKVAVTLDLHVRYFKPLTMTSGEIRCEGAVINIGRTTIAAEGRLLDAAGRLCGHATSSLALIDAARVR